MNAVAATSLVGTVVFGIAGAYMLYAAWSFMSRVNSYRRSRKGSNAELRDLYTNVRNDDDDVVLTSRKKGKHGKKGKHSKKDKKAKIDKREKRKDQMIYRYFHYHILNYIFGSTSIAYSVFYLLQWSGVLLVPRISDAVLINPFRWLLLVPLSAFLSGLLASMFVNHYVMDLVLVQMFGGVGRVILGVAMFLAVGSVPFWVLFGVAAALMVIAFLFLWGRDTLRASRALVLCFYVLVGVAYMVVYLASPEEFGWLSNLVTLIVYLLLDVITVIVPAFVVVSDWYFTKYGIPVLPLMLYESYGLGHWWKAHTNDELHYLWPLTLLMVRPKLMAKNHHRHHKLDGDEEEGELVMMSHCNICNMKEAAKSTTPTTSQEATAATTSSSDVKKNRKSSRDVESDESVEIDSDSDEASESGSDDSEDEGSNTEVVPPM